MVFCLHTAITSSIIDIELHDFNVILKRISNSTIVLYNVNQFNERGSARAGNTLHVILKSYCGESTRSGSTRQGSNSSLSFLELQWGVYTQGEYWLMEYSFTSSPIWELP